MLVSVWVRMCVGVCGYKSLKNDQATRLFFFFSEPKLKEDGVQTAKCIMEGEVWGTRLHNADTCVSKEPKYGSLNGEATECRLCKYCGCMLNTDYI